MTRLPADVHRCPGVGEDGDWREGCETCLRRTSPPHDRQTWMEPPSVIEFWCEALIEPEDVP